MARKTDPASKEAGLYKDVTQRVKHNFLILNVEQFTEELMGKYSLNGEHRLKACVYTSPKKILSVTTA